MSLPLLPGNNFDKKVGQTRHHLSHHFDKKGGVIMHVGERKPGIGGQPLLGQDLRPQNSVYPREGSDKPAWVAFDKQVLCFEAYFQESVVERSGEQYRIRNVRVLFYLEDDTVQVIEPRTKNAGYNQGVIVARHRIPRPKPYDDTFYTCEDFNVQKEIEIYGKKFKLVSCDEFTRNFLTKLGVRVADAIEPPKDPYKNMRVQQDGAQNPLRPYEKIDSLKQFLEYDRHVLRYACVWDDRDTKFGEIRRFKLLYHLADDTIEVLEVLAPNSGRESSSTFLSRQKLPMEIIHMGKPGDKPTRTVLNVIGNFFDGGRYILDNLKTGSLTVNYYKDSDLMIGRTVNVFGRKMLLVDCDEFTREFNRKKFGVSNFEAIPYDTNEHMRSVVRANPPYNGFGSEEDSLASCQKMVPEPPKKNFIKWMTYDRNGLDSNILRFVAKILTKDPIQASRRFIVSYFLSDDSIHVHEPPVRNSGINGGRFLERMKVKKPTNQPFATKLPEYYLYKDFHVGAELMLNNFVFKLYDADEYCYNFMEGHASMFPYSNAEIVFRKFRSMLDADKLAGFEQSLKSSDAHSSGLAGFNSFHSAIRRLFDEEQLNEQEIVTLARAFALQTKKETDLNSMASVIQDHLRKKNFEQFVQLRDAMKSADSFNAGEQTISVNEARCVCKGFKLPLPDYLLDMLLQYARSENGEIDARSLLEAIDWRSSPLPAPKGPANDNGNDLVELTTIERKKLSVNYEALLADLNGN